VRDGGTIVIEPNLVHATPEDRERWHIIEIPIITIAKEEVGNVITQSVIALAIANKLTGALDKDLLEEVMLSKVPSKVHEINKQAYDLGYEYASEVFSSCNEEETCHIEAKST